MLRIAAVATYSMEKTYLRCHKCNEPFQYRVPTPWVFSLFLFFLPIKSFFCARCLKKRHILLSDKDAANYINAR